MSNPLSLKQYGEIIKYSDEFKRIIDLGDDEEEKRINFLLLTEKLADKLIITVGSTEYPHIFIGSVHKTNLNGKFNIYDKIYIKRNAPGERFTQMKFYNKEQSDKYWIVSENVLYESIDDILSENENEIKTEQAEVPAISPDKFALPEESQNTPENRISNNTPFDYCNDYDGDEFASEIDLIVRIVVDLYGEDSYRVKEAIRELYAIIRCRKKARELAVNDAEFRDLDQAMNLMYLAHHHQHKKKDQALDIASGYYKVSRGKIESIWNSLVNYKGHIGKALEFNSNYKNKSKNKKR